MSQKTRTPVIDGFFTESGSDGKPHLLGGHCPKCGADHFTQSTPHGELPE